jgi:endonuclease/exonuclease/phosphatase family metal-dependent hydrolase
MEVHTLNPGSWRRFTGITLALGAVLVLGSCGPVTNLLSPTGPRFEASYAPPGSPAAPAGSPIRLITFNIKLAREIDRAIEVLEGDSLRAADVLSLQEMDAAGVDRIARALGLNYAFYPAIIHPASGDYFGPAVLSRWPIERSWKLVLPHGGWTRGQRRTATAAILRVGSARLLVYAVHLGTPIQISDRDRRDQALAVVKDASRHPGPVAIAGDFNSEGIGRLLTGQGFTWLTKRVGPTVSWFSWDHIFVRGLSPAAPPSAGVVRDNRGASDHHPVWTVAMPSVTTGAAPAGPPAPGDAPRSAGGAIVRMSPGGIWPGPPGTRAPGSGRTHRRRRSGSPRR